MLNQISIYMSTMAILVCTQPFKILMSVQIKLPSKQKVSDTYYPYFIEKAEQNLSIHTCATAVFMHAQPT